MLDKTYDPADIEPRLYEGWEKSGAFKAGRNAGGEPFTIVIPPPNVTGSLHMGHALNNTLQDILCRFERMRGRDVLWQPGTDHAGIATQMVVERQLAQSGENVSRRELGREEFVRRIWAWKEVSGGTITRQLRRLGASCDWSRERFTMDDGLSAAVRRVFVTLYKEGLIYKDKRLVNWDPHFLTAISDLEVESRETKGKMWHIRYPVEDSEESIVVATTRPETMLGDSGVAVHPDDERYTNLVGKSVILPLTGRRIPIVADNYSDPEKGTGAVKITPAHDFNDFEVGKRHDLEQIAVLDVHAHIVDADFIPAAYRGLDRFEARKKIVGDLEAQGFLVEIKDHVLMQPYGDRSGVVIEPMLTDQWYVDAATLAKPAIAAVEQGDTSFVPKNWDKTYFEWMRNIQPWCVSRQLWWGHQIPAWYGPDGHVFVEETAEAAQAAATAHYGQETALTRDEDVLDTWFSSALWPFSTLGWPEETDVLKRRYKTDVLVTGFDIIFFWVARMMMMGLHFMKEVPFHTVYIHALVRDEKGQKMSKSKGNVIDPLDLIDRFGADALRFTLAAMAAQGRDIKLATQRVEGYRNFATKLWNAARFCEMNECRLAPGFAPAAAGHTINRWVLGEAERVTAAVVDALETYRFNEAAGAVYQFVWGTFCDWYLELIKPLLNGEDEAVKAETRATAAHVLDRILVLLHPFMPFITEELWRKMAEGAAVTRETDLVLAPWPVADAGLADPAADAEVGWVIGLVTEIRALRAEANVPAGARLDLVLVAADADVRARVGTHGDLISRLARLESIAFADAAPKGSVQLVVAGTTAALALGDVIDLAAERKRLEKEIGKAEQDLAKIEAKLANPAFTAKAPPEVIEEQQERREAALQTRGKLSDALARLIASL
ncbi:valine--tRNA ligase [Zavarzinia compransoris]|uniref:valine--tRNA ligase n=1 Tax=Zavarzinia marina TaxID=2911065 RepID=UPI001F23FFE1|nr:valine--tRNA ligase [Zavarzinia marina]MCF4165038.1 valine--tRNA ligase [Zavarzinia marina]